MNLSLGVGNLFLIDILFPGGENRLVFQPKDIRLAFQEKIVIRYSEEFIPVVSDQIAVGVVEQYPAVLPVLDKDRLGKEVDDFVKVVSGFRQSLLRPLALGDVMRNAEQRLFTAPLAMQDLRLHQNAGPVPGLQRNVANHDFTGHHAG